MTSVITEFGTYYQQNSVYSLFADDNDQNIAFTTFEDMLEDAIKRHENLGQYNKYRFVPVYWAFINNRPINTVGMLRIVGNFIEFTHLESGRREFKNAELCKEYYTSFKMGRPTHEQEVAYSIDKFNEETKSNPDTPYAMGYNLTRVPIIDDLLSESTILLLRTAVVRLNERRCNRTKV
jgi:hypothetical protein